MAARPVACDTHGAWSARELKLPTVRTDAARIAEIPAAEIDDWASRCRAWHAASKSPAAESREPDHRTISCMEMPRAHPRWGIEFDWLGIDQRGHVAVFTTAGYGPVPENVNLHLTDVDRAIDRLRRLPVIGEAGQVVKPASDGNYADWYTYATQGFYAYDWNIWHGPYIRLSVPTVPIAIGSLPSSMQAVARYVTFELDFAQASQIEVEYREPPLE